MLKVEKLIKLRQKVMITFTINNHSDIIGTSNFCK
jgi:hypothetical protein